MKRSLDALLAGSVLSIFLLNIPGAGAATEKIIYSFKNVLGTDGQGPASGLINVNGMLYGTTFFGAIGNTDYGTLYAVDRKTGAESVLYSVGGGTDGSYPLAGLINVNGTLYGTTSLGGGGPCNEGCGTVFAFNLSTGAETVVRSFAGGADGDGPVAGLLRVKGKLYGTTYYGGGGSCTAGNGNGCGTVFSFNPRTGRENVLHAFQDNSSDGTYPTAGLIDVNGVLHGTTYYGGGSSNCTKGNGVAARFSRLISRPARKRCYIPSAANPTAPIPRPA